MAQTDIITDEIIDEFAGFLFVSVDIVEYSFELLAQ
jgi:hypothetical protein